MIQDVRQAYNQYFTKLKYEQFLQEIAAQFEHLPPFRIAETPVFISSDLREKLFEACEGILDVLVQPNFKDLSASALTTGQVVPDEDEHTLFLQMDFGVCWGKDGTLEPQLIEIQGFPSLYFYQDMVAHLYRKHFAVPDHFTHLFNGLTSEDYIALLKKLILGGHAPEHVILLEIEPDQQATAIDFFASKHFLGIEYVCLSDLICEGRDVFYIKNGKKTPVHRIYNRVIFDELLQRRDLPRTFDFTKSYNIEWAGHPNWFFRISKHTLPFLSHLPFVPKTMFLKDLSATPDNLQDYVLKPLFSFSGSGVIINPTPADFDAITTPENYILQQKVEYAAAIETPSGPTKCEIRMLTVWEPGAARPRIINNLSRLSKGEMIGVKYNKDKDWVGGSVCFFEG